MSNIALIPARSGSERVPNKNIRILKNKPLIAHTIEPAIESRLFLKVIVITDSEEYAEISRSYGAEIIALRPIETATANAPDILWVKWIHDLLRSKEINAEKYAILRPTSPFRTIETFKKAFNLFEKNPNIDTLRAIQKVSEHPGKMWVEKCENIVPLLPFGNEHDFWHNSQTNTLPEIFIQNASFEIFKAANISQYHSITGQNIVGFKTDALEGFDINTEFDFIEAKRIIENL